jgi:hypothetical protein
MRVTRSSPVAALPRVVGGAVLVGLWTGAPRPAAACAALVHTPGEFAESPAQEAILWRDTAQSQTVTELRVQWEGDAGAFGWVITLPAGFVSAEDGDPARFDALREATDPEVFHVGVGISGGGDPGCGRCAGDGKAGSLSARNALDTGGVDVVAEAFTGTYALEVIAADDGAALTAWLEAEGWAVGGTQASLEAYADEGGYEFVLVKILPRSSPDGVGELPPLVLRTTDPRLFFPSRMAAGAGPTELHTRIWVAGPGAATVSGWTSEALTHLWLDGEQPLDELWTRALFEIGGDAPTFAEVYQGDAPALEGMSGMTLTRFEAVALAAAHTVDATFTTDGAPRPMRTTIELDGDRASPAGALPVALLGPLLGLGAWGLRRRRKE